MSASLSIELPFSNLYASHYEVVASPDDEEHPIFTLTYLPVDANEGDIEVVFCDDLDDIFVFEFLSGTWHESIDDGSAELTIEIEETA